MVKEIHGHETSKAFLKSVGDHVENGGAAVLIAADPSNADLLVAGVLASGQGIEVIDVSAAHQQELVEAAA